MKTRKPVESLILSIRGQKVIIDAELAALYGVTTKRLNEQVKRNADRFPGDFMFPLTAQEWAHLKSQIATSSLGGCQETSASPKRSKLVTGSHGGRRKVPFAFTEHGALMAANVLNSRDAVRMSVYVVRAFIQQRELLSARSDVIAQLAQMDARLLIHDEALRVIWRELEPLINPPPDPPKPQIGFGRSEPGESAAAA